jgi:hypothetical protein
MLNPFKLARPHLAFTIGDPHFFGFEGESFDFMGEPNRYYNLLSDTDIQVNAYFVYWVTSGADNFTATEQIGILAGDHRIQVTPAGLTLDGTSWPEDRTAFRVGDGAIATIEPFGLADRRFAKHMTTDPRGGEFVRGYQVKTRCGYDFIVTVATDHVNPLFLNLSCKMNGRLWPHGIIGQTADHDGVARQARGHNGEGIIAGEYRDYEVSSLWSRDFKFSKYGVDERRRQDLRIIAGSRINTYLRRLWRDAA